MAANPNKLFLLWQELKRRNVLRSLAIYAGTAFIILEATTIIFPRWGFPDWTIDLVLYLIIFGAFINIVIAWIFDITPEGFQITKPSSELQEGEKRAVSNLWKIATYVSVVVIIGLILLNIFNLRKVSESLSQYGKSIAVLPLINDTQINENDQFISGALVAIISNLSKIGEIGVIQRESVEQYRDTIIPIPKVAEKLKVSFVLIGSMQKYGHQFRITLRLVDQNDSQLWSSNFEREIKPDQGEEYFAFWSEIAQQVAEQLNVLITPEEKQRIENIPTTSLDAYIFYQRGMDIYSEWYLEKRKDTMKLENAVDLFYEALEYDSTYAPAYTGLAWVVLYDTRKYNSAKIKLDSVLTLVNKAITLDDQLAQAYSIKGIYYRRLFGFDSEKALVEYNKALKYDPNDWNALWNKSYYYASKDLSKSIEYLHEAISRNPEFSNLQGILRDLVIWYRYAGFFDKAEYYNKERLKLSRDSLQYFVNLSWIEHDRCNWDKLIKTSNKRLALDSTDVEAMLFIGAAYVLLEEYEESLRYLEKAFDGMIASGDTIYPIMKWLSYAYWKNGDLEFSDYYIEQELEYYNKLLEQRREPGDLCHRAMALAYRGMKEEALKDLREIYDLQTNQHRDHISMMADWPFFDNIRDDPEFQKIHHDMEVKFWAQHERVRQWLEENEML